MNRLAHTNSPYLLQHRDNPVDWYPWGEEAFEAARKLDRPIFLSIGYATCHWCHVMAHESFEDEEVARLMNAAFINVKVDREERPDVDSVYMSVCQMLTGHGGWPLTILMTPDKKPFFAATYIPRDSRYGRPGMKQLIPRVETLWRTEREGIFASAERIIGMLRQQEPEAGASVLTETTLHQAHRQLADRYDAQFGGFGSAPKFPTPHNFAFLLRYHRRTGDPAALSMVTHTLRQMRQGGLFDHIGFGFHRYSTDRHWLLPHFEKMLYDQAQLALAYTEAFLATREPEFEQTAREILTYVLRDLHSPEGAFFSAEDADSEGEEGKFYVWTEAELNDVLGADDARFFCRVFTCHPGGNFAEEATGEKSGANIPYRSQPDDVLAAELNCSEEAFAERLETIREKLFAHRAQRVRPGLDDKVLTDWNGLMIAALATAARAFDAPEYAGAARRAADFLLATMRRPDGSLLHRYRNGESGIIAHLDDYVFLAWGLLELYETTFEIEDLTAALELMDYALAHFWDENDGGFYFTSDEGEVLLIRQKELYDGAIPAGNSVAALVLLKLARLTGRNDLEERASQLLTFASGSVAQYPSAYTMLLTALDFAIGPAHEVVLVAERQVPDLAAMLDELRSGFSPNHVVLLVPPEDAGEITRLAPFTASFTQVEGRPTAYVCRNFACAMPTTDPEAMASLLRA